MINIYIVYMCCIISCFFLFRSVLHSLLGRLKRPVLESLLQVLERGDSDSGPCCLLPPGDIREKETLCHLKGNLCHLKGNPVSQKGKPCHLKGNPVTYVKGNPVSLKRKPCHLKGNPVT